MRENSAVQSKKKFNGNNTADQEVRSFDCRPRFYGLFTSQAVFIAAALFQRLEEARSVSKDLFASD